MRESLLPDNDLRCNLHDRLQASAGIWGETVRFSQKDPSKIPLVLSLCLASVVRPGSGKLTRATYFTIRHLDDVLDGEMKPGKAPALATEDSVAYTTSIKNQLLGLELFDNTRISAIGRYAISGLIRRAQPSEDPRALMANIIDGMMMDQERRSTRAAVPHKKLVAYSSLFNNFVDVTLIALGSDVRSGQFPNFGPSQFGLYSLRDLKKDWELGIINVPQEVLDAASLDTTASYETVIENETVEPWYRSERAAGILGMNDTLDRLRTIKDPVAKIMIGGLAKGATKGPFLRFGEDKT